MTYEPMVLAGDCLDLLKTLPADSVDSVVTDPPYELNFMGRSWDRSGIAFNPEVWAECMRVLKPGGHLLAFGGSRTFHRIACAIEDAGFEIRDSIAWMYGCLTADAEVLTESGWKYGTDVVEGERVAQWDAQTGMISLVAVEQTFRAPWDGPMRVLRNADTAQVLTPNHRVYHQTFDRKQVGGVRAGEWSDWKVAEAGDISTCARMRVPVAGEHEGPGIGGDDYAALLGWVWTEGGYDHSGSGVRIYQSSVNSDKCDEIAALLDRLGPHKRYDRERVYRGRVYVESTWYVSGALAEQVRKDLPGKRPTYDLLWRMTGSEKRSLLRAAMLGDGTGWGTRSEQFFQKHEDDLVWLQTLLALIGRSGKVGMRTTRQGGALYLRQRNTTELQARHLRDHTEHYAGEVWCVKVPTGAFVARRNGQVFITGNSGFPKSLDVSKAIDKAAGATREVIGQRTDGRYASGFSEQAKKALGGVVASESATGFTGEMGVITAPATDEAAQWEGWGTALKPAFEPIIVARKPLSEKTVAKNVLKHGTGAINIDASRIGTTDRLGGGHSTSGQQMDDGWRRPWMDDPEAVAANAERSRQAVEKAETLGRWPANVMIGHLEDCEIVGTQDETFGGGAKASSGFVDGYEHDGFKATQITTEVWRCAPGCQVAELDRQSGTRKSGGDVSGKEPSKTGDTGIYGTYERVGWEGYKDIGGASRFFYCPKAKKSERVTVDGVSHPTVKPLALMRYLIRLVTPPDGTVLDPFTGSGTTLEAAMQEGFNSIGIEKDATYLPLINERIQRSRHA